jgi:predicted phosphodiesterase
VEVKLEMHILAIISILAIAIVVAILTNFRFLLYPFRSKMNPLTTARKYELTGNTLFISDLHLRANTPFPFTGQLRACVERENIENLVINGDLFDSPEDAEKILRTGDKLDFLGLREVPLKSYWILGSPRHDPHDPTTTSLNVLGKCAIFIYDGLSVVAYHGHDLSMKGGIAHAINRFISPLIVEKMWKRLARVDVDTWVIFGHTHIPGLDLKSRIANCGAWATYRLVRPTGTGIILNANVPMLHLVAIGYPS